VKNYQVHLKNEAATQKVGELFAVYLKNGILYLEGQLSEGKTCFSQAIIRAAGYNRRVKSPTSILVET